MAENFYRQKFAWLNQVKNDPAVKSLSFMIAYVIADLIDEELGYAWPSVDRLASECHVTATGVKKARAVLVDRGHLAIEASTGRGHANRYRWIIKETSAATETPLRGQQIDPLSDLKGQQIDPLSDLKGQQIDPLSDLKGQQNAPLSNGKGQQTAPFPTLKGQQNELKGQQSHHKGVTKRPPTLSIDPIYNPIERVSLSCRISERAADTADPDDPFVAFWKTYPRRIGKAAALKAYNRAVKSGAQPDEILLGAARFAADRDREPDPSKREQYTPHPATWLNAARWADEPSSVVVPFASASGARERRSMFELARLGT